MVFNQKHMPKIGGIIRYFRRAAPAAMKMSSRWGLEFYLIQKFLK
jgi:hypothetical protein